MCSLKKYYWLLVFTGVILYNVGYSQFAPPAGMPGTTAIHADSNIFVDWAIDCQIERGYADISNMDIGMATFGTHLSGIGKADNDVVSLGDGGSATLTFTEPITDGEGWDFAIFENSFSDTFLELAFVEVSSDGVNFYPFLSTSLTPDSVQVGTFGETKATHINNLAGKYRGGYGVPFDLRELSNISELDIYNITHIRIIDVVGSIDDNFATFDANNNKINDPWPTPFESSGFDFDAVGVIHNMENSSVNNHGYINLKLVYPNPAIDNITLDIAKNEFEIVITDLNGRILLKQFNNGINRIDIGQLESGLYSIIVKTSERYIVSKFIKL